MALLKTVLVSMAVAGTMTTAAYAHDRKPTGVEKAEIVHKLHKHGFVKWDEIELDDGVWEIDDAVHESGKVYDLKLHVGSLKLLKADLE